MDIVSLLLFELVTRKIHKVFAKIPRLDMDGLCWHDDVLHDARAVLSAKEAVPIVANSVVHDLQVSTKRSQVDLLVHTE